MKILLFGGSGLLGKCLLGYNKDIIAPSHSEVPIENKELVFDFIEKHRPDIVINSSAFIDNRRIEKDPTIAIETNIIGSANISIQGR